ncbi:glutathione S-transferase N-terminal domain-containing protein [Phenylobacterium sp.]|uniref:glutathione S-transferase N-terminal domain-containing protein n=1 Tax=Phenylobacterium sp. TaxID=1871053 RepID=UPI0025ED245D|nr:glutathione S-transferase N-terminal domain-containing protein [Phenylobacterium sp.]
MGGSNDRVMLSGVPGSPYTRKMVALLRYRRIPYSLVQLSHEAPNLPRPKVSLLPTFYFPDGAGGLTAATDSTPLLRRLEREHAGREARPADPALALIDAVLEDFGDEWLTKAMFHYRWAYEPDIAKAAAVLPAYTRSRLPDEELQAAGRAFAERQIPRLRYVGSNPTTGPVIEASYVRFLDLMEAHLRDHRFLLGGRPAACDFAAYGQLTQLIHFDPTSMALTHARAPRVAAWTLLMEDLTGEEPTEADWFDAAALPATLTAILAEAGRTYAPLLLANARAVRDGAAEVQTHIDGQPWVMQPFPYQAKCLGWLREEYAALAPEDRTRADAALAGTGCEAMFTA